MDDRWMTSAYKVYNNNHGNNNETVNPIAKSSSTLMSRYDVDVVRLIGQHLASLGLKRTVNLLLQETGLSGLDHPAASEFQNYIYNGDWENAHKFVNDIVSHCSQKDTDDIVKEMKLMISEQKFLELIEENQYIKALRCLRLEITPSTGDLARIQHLTTLLMCKSIEDVRLKANWPGKGIKSRQLLVESFQKFIPPLIMLPSKRLSTLLSQAIQLQRERCALHLKSSDSDDVDLTVDHVCDSSKFPLDCRQVIDSHQTEIWFCKFSNDGTKLATGGLGGKVKIWDVDPGAAKLTERCTLENYSFSIVCLEWSPTDEYLLVCLSDDKPDLNIWQVSKEIIHKTINLKDEEATTTCSWHPNGRQFAAASIRGNFNIYDIDGNTVGTREGVRVQCLSFLHKSDKVVLAADILNRIRSYAVQNLSLEADEEEILKERHAIMSFTIDSEDRYIAVNLMEQGVHLWDYKARTRLRMLVGVRQRNFAIHSCFSSPDASFLASGSEDGKVYIYHVDKDHPVAILHGHSRCVNCVTWNKKHPRLLASVSDDGLIRLWGPSLTSSSTHAT